MKKLATLEKWAQRLAEREDLLVHAKADGKDSRATVSQRNRRIVLALCEAYSAGYHDSIKDNVRKGRD